jgi:hypothetical protein
MSVFTSRVPPITLSVPGEPSQSVTIRKITPNALHTAAVVKSRAIMRESTEDMQAIGGAESFKALRSLVSEEQQNDQDAKKTEDGGTNASAEKAPSPLAGYDRIDLMLSGVAAWTFDMPLTRDSFEDLDDETQDWLATEVLKLARPSLFQTAEQIEDARFSG